MKLVNWVEGPQNLDSLQNDNQQSGSLLILFCGYFFTSKFYNCWHLDYRCNTNSEEVRKYTSKRKKMLLLTLGFHLF
jgi:hypothetical protein